MRVAEQLSLFEEDRPEPDFPKYCRYRTEMCRVLYYEGDGVFRLLGKGDRQMSVHRDRFAFVRPKKKEA